MPIYVYRCEAKECNQLTEMQFPIKSYPQRVSCSHCADPENEINCEAVLEIQPMSFKINGDNSGSTPKRYR